MHTLQHDCRVWGTASQSSTQLSSSATVARTQAGRTTLVVRAVVAPSQHTKARKLQVAPERQPRAENVGLNSASHFYVDHTCIGAVPDKGHADFQIASRIFVIWLSNARYCTSL